MHVKISAPKRTRAAWQNEREQFRQRSKYFPLAKKTQKQNASHLGGMLVGEVGCSSLFHCDSILTARSQEAKWWVLEEGSLSSPGSGIDYLVKMQFTLSELQWFVTKYLTNAYYMGFSGTGKLTGKKKKNNLCFLPKKKVSKYTCDVSDTFFKHITCCKRMGSYMGFLKGTWSVSASLTEMKLR